MSEFPPVVFIDIYEVQARSTPWASASSRPQRWRWRALSEGNGKKLASGEAYTNLDDLLHTVQLLFGSGSTLFLRQHEKGDELLRRAAPDVE